MILVAKTKSQRSIGRALALSLITSSLGLFSMMPTCAMEQCLTDTVIISPEQKLAKERDYATAFSIFERLKQHSIQPIKISAFGGKETPSLMNAMRLFEIYNNDIETLNKPLEYIRAANADFKLHILGINPVVDMVNKLSLAEVAVFVRQEKEDQFYHLFFKTKESKEFEITNDIMAEFGESSDIYKFIIDNIVKNTSIDECYITLNKFLKKIIFMQNIETLEGLFVENIKAQSMLLYQNMSNESKNNEIVEKREKIISLSLSNMSFWYHFISNSILIADNFKEKVVSLEKDNWLTEVNLESSNKNLTNAKDSRIKSREKIVKREIRLNEQAIAKTKESFGDTINNKSTEATAAREMIATYERENAAKLTEFDEFKKSLDLTNNQEIAIKRQTAANEIKENLSHINKLKKLYADIFYVFGTYLSGKLGRGEQSESYIGSFLSTIKTAITLGSNREDLVITPLIYPNTDAENLLKIKRNLLWKLTHTENDLFGINDLGYGTTKGLFTVEDDVYAQVKQRLEAEQLRAEEQIREAEEAKIKEQLFLQEQDRVRKEEEQKRLEVAIKAEAERLNELARQEAEEARIAREKANISDSLQQKLDANREITNHAIEQFHKTIENFELPKTPTQSPPQSLNTSNGSLMPNTGEAIENMKPKVDKKTASISSNTKPAAKSMDQGKQEPGKQEKKTPHGFVQELLNQF